MVPWRNFKRFSNKVLKQPGYTAKVLTKRVKAFLYYYFCQGKSSYPEAITLFLTHRCNLRCKMCGQWGDSGVTKKMSHDSIKEELPFREYKKFIDEQDLSFERLKTLKMSDKVRAYLPLFPCV